MILTADDYGISRSVSAGIRELLERKRLTSVSCMVTDPGACSDLAALRHVSANFDTGLHLVLTDVPPLSRPTRGDALVDVDGHMRSFTQLAMLAHCGRLNGQSLYVEIREQVLKFRQVYGRLPDFIDGHQHVHALAVIRDALVAVHENLRLSAYIRQFTLPHRWVAKTAWKFSSRLAAEALVIHLQSQPLAGLLREKRIPSNRWLLGHYPYHSEYRFADVFREYISVSPTAGDLFYCHPGYVDAELEARDRLTGPRVEILKFLLSDRFIDLIEANGIKLQKMNIPKALEAEL